MSYLTLYPWYISECGLNDKLNVWMNEPENEHYLRYTHTFKYTVHKILDNCTHNTRSMAKLSVT